MVKATCWARPAVTVMNWQVMSTLPVVMFGMRASDACVTNSILDSVVEQALRDHLGDVDVVADELALFVLEMPGRVGAAGPDDQLAALEHFLQLALSFRRACYRPREDQHPQDADENFQSP